MWYVAHIAEQKLQAVLAWWQLDRDLGLSAAKMHMLRISRDRCIRRGQIRVDNQVVMTGIGLIGTRGGHAHATQTEYNADGAGDRVTIGRGNNVNTRALR